MPATPFAERSGSLKVLGAAFIALVLFFVWLTYAFFNKTFVDSDFVTLNTTQAGQNLPKNADIKLRGMIVGSVREIEPADKGVTMKLAFDPDLIDRVPAGVTAQIVPKTLFGEKYIALIAPDGTGPDSESLRAGDTITDAEVPIEVEKLLNDFYPLLQAVQPEELSYTLTAVSQALEGRGEKLGDTLVTLNDYLQELNPDVPTLVDDIEKLGTVSDGYAAAMPEIGRLLRNTVVTANTVVTKRAQLAGFFDEGTRLARTLTTFVDVNGDNLEALAEQSRPVVAVSAKYSTTFPCFLSGMANIIPRLDTVFSGRTVHIDLKTLPEQPTAYSDRENARFPSQRVFDTTAAAQPKGKGSLEQVCDRLPQYDPLGDDSGNPYGQDHTGNENGPYPGPDPKVYKLIGLESDHNGKFTPNRGPNAVKPGDQTVFDRTAAASLAQTGYYDVSLMDVDSEEQRRDLRQMAALTAGVDAADVPDIASLLLSPVVRGAEGSIR